MFVVKLFNIDPSSYKMEGCEVNLFKTLERSKQFIMERHWVIAWENCDTDLELDEYLSEYTFEDIQDKLYDTFEYEIEEVIK